MLFRSERERFFCRSSALSKNLEKNLAFTANVSSALSKREKERERESGSSAGLRLPFKSTLALSIFLNLHTLKWVMLAHGRLHPSSLNFNYLLSPKIKKKTSQMTSKQTEKD